jgi:hypothetical protein
VAHDDGTGTTCSTAADADAYADEYADEHAYEHANATKHGIIIVYISWFPETSGCFPINTSALGINS